MTFLERTCSKASSIRLGKFARREMTVCDGSSAQPFPPIRDTEAMNQLLAGGDFAAGIPRFALMWGCWKVDQGGPCSNASVKS